MKKHMPWMLLAGGLLAGIVLAADRNPAGDGPGIAASQPNQDESPAHLVVRAYDVKDIMLLAREHRFPGGLAPATDLYESKSSSDTGSSGGSLYGATAEKEATTMQSLLVDLLRCPDLSDQAVYQFAGSLLLIKQTPANHKTIELRLAEIRKGVERRRTVTIQARWVALDDKQLAQIAPDAGAKRTVPQEVNPDAIKGIEAAYRGETTCLEGTPFHIASVRGQTVVISATPIVAENVVAYSPTFKMVFWGAMLEATVAVTPEGNSASIDFHSVVAQPKEGGTIPFAEVSPQPTTAPAAIANGPDRVDFSLWSQGATLRLPLGRPVIAGGMNGPEIKGKHLYLILEVNAAKN